MFSPAGKELTCFRPETECLLQNSFMSLSHSRLVKGNEDFEVCAKLRLRDGAAVSLLGLVTKTQTGSSITNNSTAKKFCIVVSSAEMAFENY